VARGWESKSIEEQISEHEAESVKSSKNKLSCQEVEQRSKREGILLARLRTVNTLQSTRDERYRALLERTLAHLDEELGKLR
jgi:hypothetical protein